jgi:hypothetical protein
VGTQASPLLETTSQRGSQRGGSRGPRSKLSTLSDPLSISGLDVAMRPLLDQMAKLLNGKLTVRILIMDL